MSEILDILTVYPTKCQQFTVNTAVDHVPLVEVAVPDYRLFNSNGKQRFLNGDNFSILSTGYVLPEAFTFSKLTAAMGTKALMSNQLAIKGVSGKTYSIDVLGRGLGVDVPFENFELALDIFVDTGKQIDLNPPHGALNENFYLETNLQNYLDISMLGIPASFNGKVFYVTPFFKILHNLQMF